MASRLNQAVRGEGSEVWREREERVPRGTEEDPESKESICSKWQGYIGMKSWGKDVVGLGSLTDLP